MEEIDEERDEYVEEEVEFEPSAAAELEAPEPVAEEEPEEEVVPAMKPIVVEVPRLKPRAQARRVVVVDQPEIDWLWYERTPDSFEWGWVDSEERVQEKTPPADLWWNRQSSREIVEKSI